MTLSDVMAAALFSYAAASVLISLAVFFGKYRLRRYEGKWFELLIYPALLITSFFFLQTMGYIADEDPAMYAGIEKCLYALLCSSAAVAVIMVVALFFKIRSGKGKSV